MEIIVANYNPDWPVAYQKEEIKITQTLGATLSRSYHIGSTSVPGLMAKPIIDILLAVHDLQELDDKSSEMAELGYEVMGAYGIPGRRYFRKGINRRTHHVHAFKTGDSNLKRHLAFRDYLIAHPEIAREYGHLKYQISQNCDNDMGKYCDAKDPFVKLHEQNALEWYQKVGH
ncbi:MAG: GrpB family protein [Bacteroidia bacterium]|nr:GrpB family protein [Bacteroidia bacterium]